MRVKSVGELIFTCRQDEEVTLSMTCDNTLFGINYAFKPAVPNTFVENPDSGVITFTVTRDTDLIISFNYSEQVGGIYECNFQEIENDADGTFTDRVRQFGPLPQRRAYTFLLEE